MAKHQGKARMADVAPASGSEPRGPRFFAGMVAGKAAATALGLLHRNAGQFPGVLACKADPRFMAKVACPAQTVMVTGSNGKTTTSNLIDDILTACGKAPVNNRMGGNVYTGIASTLLKNARVGGGVKNDLAVMEIDERTCKIVLPQVVPTYLLCTNLYRDQYVRSAHVGYVFDIVSRSIPASTHLILNADDLISCRLAPGNPRTYFGIARLPGDEAAPSGVVSDLNACPECGGRLAYDYCHLGHMGRVHCVSCGYTNPKPDFELIAADLGALTCEVRENAEAGAPVHAYPLIGTSMADLYNELAAITACRLLGIAPSQIAAAIKGGVKVVASRYDEETVCGKRLVNVMAKSESGMPVSNALIVIQKQPGTKTVVLMPDNYHKEIVTTTTEFSGWIYESDYGRLADPLVKHIVVAGKRAYDFALRMYLEGVDPGKVTFVPRFEDAADAVRFDDVDGVFWARDLDCGPQAAASVKRVAERIRAGETEPAGPVTSLVEHAPEHGGKGLLVESLYPEFSNQAGDNGNMMYVRACLPEAEAVETHLHDRPTFADRRPDFIYLGCMTEAEQVRVIEALRPHRDRLVELIEDGVPMLFTGNAAEILGEAITDTRDGEVEALGILPFKTARDLDVRYKRMVMGELAAAPGDEAAAGCAGTPIIGFKAQFTQAYGHNEDEALFRCERGFGLSEDSAFEGWRRKNLIATWLLGPILPTNPQLMRYVLTLMGVKDAELAFPKTAEKAYGIRLGEFRDPNCEVDD